MTLAHSGSRTNANGQATILERRQNWAIHQTSTPPDLPAPAPELSAWSSPTCTTSSTPNDGIPVAAKANVSAKTVSSNGMGRPEASLAIGRGLPGRLLACPVEPQVAGGLSED